MNDRQDIEARIQDYLDGRLDAGERAAFERKLEGDAALRARVRDLQAAGDALRTGAELPPGFHVRARERFERAHGAQRKVAARGFPFWQFAGVAASLLLVGVLFYPQLTEILEGNPPAQATSASMEHGSESAESRDAEGPAPAAPEKDDAPEKASPGAAMQTDDRLRAEAPSKVTEVFSEMLQDKEIASIGTANEISAELSARSAEKTATKKEAAPSEPDAPQYRQDVADGVDAADPAETADPAEAAHDGRDEDASEAESDDSRLLESPKRSRFAANGPTGARTLPQPTTRERPTPERLEALKSLGYLGGDDATLPAGDAAPLPPEIAEQRTVRLIRDLETWNSLGWTDWPVDFESHAVVVLGTYGQPLACGAIARRVEGDRLILTLPGESGPGAFGCALRVDRQVTRVEVVQP